ncbi:MAG: hypothetical protein FWG44_05165, partial [Oscillospiraceae bacterium]|nr:hypothetical protein [Oscillospiraceae bacterium]
IASNGENVNFRSGEIKAFVDLVNGNGPYSSYYQNSDYGIPYYKSAIDAFAESFANLMNNANGAGYDPMRAMFGSADDYYDVDGKLVSRAPITAANIKMTEEWRVDTSMIGMPFRVTTMLDFGNLTVGSTYELNIGIEGYGIRTIAFTANPLEDPPGSGNFTTDVDRNDAVNQINMQLESVFHELKPPVTISREGLLPNKLLEGNLVTVATGIVNGFPTADIHENHYVSNANLDGNHAHILMLALDETVKYGRALDFAGTPFDYVAFLSNRLGQGLMFLDEQIDTMTVTSNNLLDGRDAVSGVSNDEEGINMLIYQKWYNAAARMMTALDECLDRIINGMGRVGL